MYYTNPTPGNWNYKIQGFKITIGNDDSGRTKHGHDYTVAIIDDNSLQAEANAKLIAAAPEMFEMIRKLKDCIKRLSQDDLSQFDRDTEAQWEGEAHELLTRINPGYYKNANEPA